MTANAMSRTTATARRLSVQAELQPWSGAFDTAKTSSASPVVTVTAPAMSSDFRPSARLSCTKRGVRMKASAPTGTLMKKIHSQPR